MHKKLVLSTILFFILFFAAQTNSGAMSINNLIENAKSYDGKNVEIKGEAIGDTMIRGKYGWINIWDGTGAIGVWTKKEDLEKIQFKGNYKNRGDTIKVIGTFGRSCSEHGGDTDIHAKEIFIVNIGHKIEHPIDLRKVMWCAVLFIVVLGLILFNYSLSKIAEKR